MKVDVGGLNKVVGIGTRYNDTATSTLLDSLPSSSVLGMHVPLCCFSRTSIASMHCAVSAVDGTVLTGCKEGVD
jgi:hypothetical protein